MTGNHCANNQKDPYVSTAHIPVELTLYGLARYRARFGWRRFERLGFRHLGFDEECLRAILLNVVPEVVRDGLSLEGSVEFRLVLYGLQDDVSPHDGHIDWIGWRGKVRLGVSQRDIDD